MSSFKVSLFVQFIQSWRQRQHAAEIEATRQKSTGVSEQTEETRGAQESWTGGQVRQAGNTGAKQTNQRRARRKTQWLKSKLDLRGEEVQMQVEEPAVITRMMWDRCGGDITLRRETTPGTQVSRKWMVTRKHEELQNNTGSNQNHDKLFLNSSKSLKNH